ncbi:galactose oxidase-like domain-containing protein, partial [Kitasatospora sp. NPDC018614]
PGLSDANMMETSATVPLPPAQDQRYLVVGGGGVGESRLSSRRTRIVDLKARDPRFTDGPSLDEGTRYPQTSILPDDSVLVSGGSRDYRGRGDSDILQARLYDPGTDTFRRVADPLVGRDYHAGSILLPDGRVMFFGSDPLYGDKAGTRPGAFEQRIEIYTPPYLYRDSRPSLSGGPRTVARGASATFTSRHAASIRKARLIRPSASTHVTDVDQRSVALDFTASGDTVTVTVPKNRNLVRSGWYMLFVDDDRGTPSKARWVKVL